MTIETPNLLALTSPLRQNVLPSFCLNLGLPSGVAIQLPGDGRAERLPGERRHAVLPGQDARAGVRYEVRTFAA